MELESEDRAAWGLRRYLRLVAGKLGIDDAGQFISLAQPITAYLPLDLRLQRFPTLDVALVWHEEHGWAIGVEPDSSSPVAVLSYLGLDVLVPPRVVAGFVRDMFEDRFPGRPDPPDLRAASISDDLEDRLAEYAPPVGHNFPPAASSC